ncbi:putative D-aminoacylase [Podospora aff. communis PSN243]|uniref:D-aminoacylase n=1 Tax=Podospora aff. communis PSN243 TaxID=3040156 RepID=A0AAV9GPF6_9PEZI|nr:putative D-aminoacylase [Podospora aff. communis PSN243]
MALNEPNHNANTVDMEALAPKIEEIRKICGLVGISIGVAHKKFKFPTETYFRGFGTFSGKEGDQADQNTLYYIGSLTNSFTATAIGILVGERKLQWTTPIKDVIPDFRPDNDTVHETATIADLLSHGTGLEGTDALWSQANNKPLLDRGQVLRTIEQLRAASGFRAEFRYNNWGYEIAGRVIETLSGRSYGEFLNERIFKPLRMHRTYTTASQHRVGHSIATGHLTQDDGSPRPVPATMVIPGDLMNAAVGMQSSVSNLLIYYMAINKMLKRPEKTAAITKYIPPEEVVELTKARVPLSTAPGAPQQARGKYGMGWAVAQLPSSVGDTSAVYLMPETKSVVLVLSNSVGISNGADWIGQLIVHSLLEDAPPCDFVSLARSSRDFGLSAYQRIENEFRAELQGQPAIPPQPLHWYTGRYFNKTRTVSIRIRIQKVKGGEELCMAFEGKTLPIVYPLKHHNGDEFSWHMPRNKQVELGRIPVT